MALRKKVNVTKAKAARSKANKAKATKTKVGKAKVKKAKAKAKKVKRGGAPSPAPPAKRDAKSLIEHLDLHSLHEDDIKTIRDCCTAALDFRKALQNESIDATMAHAAAGYCYTKSGASSTVSIWKDGFKVGETTQADADTRGIPPCG
ncbi:hypothetical protein HAP41_0000049325 (plasmid) [Bradyrhizobium barranii subsp. apii]|uniref:Uncharacterized protein n=1 Tax=Bradyrhizobium barranii subsp. apii TaxID=2819348 RepID=A0A8T5VJW4_9BRAD|nr:hypothetical protein [Bradyrhizobium barranii]UPT92456.1 hypothetical protein HAP41_0000049325 [Bradyrhizobium barranii subsp. apii]